MNFTRIPPKVAAERGRGMEQPSTSLMLGNRRLFASMEVGTSVKIVILAPERPGTQTYDNHDSCRVHLQEPLSIRTSHTSPVRCSSRDI